eukprot:403355065
MEDNNDKQSLDNHMLYEIKDAKDIKDGEMRTISVHGNQKILIAKYQNKLYAVGNTCPHQGAALNTGMLINDKVVCPWHGAQFDIKSGALEQFPSVDGIPSYQIIENQDGKSFVKVPMNIKKAEPVPMVKRDINDKTRYVILGGGPAGLSCAETLRQSGFTGEIIVLTAEDIISYDRTQLTKNLPRVQVKDILVRDEQYIQNADIDFKLGSRVESLDVQNKQLILSSGETLHYDKLCISPGASPFKPRIPGIDQENVLPIRTYKDVEKIKGLLSKGDIKNLVIMGTGFIGSEVAASLKTKYEDEINIEVISMESVPLERQFGKDVGSVIYNQHIKNDIKMHMSKKVVEIRGENNKAHSVVLDDGTIIQADLLLLGAGVFPATQFLKGSGLEMDNWGGIICDPFLKTSVEDIFSAGDSASFPYWPTGQRVRMEHWGTAQDQGSHAAFNMMNKRIPYGNIPFLWTEHYGQAIQYVGYAFEFHEVYIQGSLEDQEFLAFYIGKGDQVLAVAGASRSLDIITYQEALQQNVMPSASKIKSGEETIETIRAKLQQNTGSRCTRAQCCSKPPQI